MVNDHQITVSTYFGVIASSALHGNKSHNTLRTTGVTGSLILQVSKHMCALWGCSYSVRSTKSSGKAPAVIFLYKYGSWKNYHSHRIEDIQSNNVPNLTFLANVLVRFLLTKFIVCFWPTLCGRFLPRDARSAERGIAIVSRLSVRPSVCLSVTLMYRGRTAWTSSKLITRIRGGSGTS